MRRLLLRTRAILRDALKPVTGAMIGAIAVGLLRATRYFDPDKTANFFGSVTRTVGPWLREHQIGRANLTPVRVGDGGKVCLFVHATTEVVADLNGYYSVLPG